MMVSARRVRLASGLVLFAYVTTHLGNHALGLISLEAMEAGRIYFVAVWRNPLGSLVLYSAWTAHVALAFWALYQRRTLRMPPWEAAQLVLGLAIPPLLVSHIVGTRVAWQLYGVEDGYSRVVLSLWALAPELGRRQIVIVVGYADAIYLTAVGDTVHVASRLEALTKDYDCELVVSEAVARRAGMRTDGLARHEITLRNRAEPLTVMAIRSAASLPPSERSGAADPSSAADASRIAAE